MHICTGLYNTLKYENGLSNKNVKLQTDDVFLIFCLTLENTQPCFIDLFCERQHNLLEFE